MPMSNSNMPRKPFPWKCSSCKEKAVREDIVTHEVDVEHDGRTHHVRIDGLKTPRCANCGLVHPDSDANEAITLAFLLQAKLLTPRKIREYRDELKLTQKQLAAAIGVAEATVSRWETGAQIQQRSLDNLLRLFFGDARVRERLVDQKVNALGLDRSTTTMTVAASGGARISMSAPVSVSPPYNSEYYCMFVKCGGETTQA